MAHNDNGWQISKSYRIAKSSEMMSGFHSGTFLIHDTCLDDR